MPSCPLGGGIAAVPEGQQGPGGCLWPWDPVEALREVNPELQDLKSIAAVTGDSIYRLAGRYGTSTGALRQDNPALMESVPYLVADGDTLANLASREQETVSACAC